MLITQFFSHNLVTFVTVLGKIYELFGILAEVHPSDMVNNSDKLYKAYLGELKAQVPVSLRENHGSAQSSTVMNTSSQLKIAGSVCAYSVLVLNVFVSDDVFNKGTETFSCSWMFERNHFSHGQLH